MLLFDSRGGFGYAGYRSPADHRHETHRLVAARRISNTHSKHILRPPTQGGGLAGPTIKENSAIINQLPPSARTEAGRRHHDVEPGEALGPRTGRTGAVFNKCGALFKSRGVFMPNFLLLTTCSIANGLAKCAKSAKTRRCKLFRRIRHNWHSGCAPHRRQGTLQPAAHGSPQETAGLTSKSFGRRPPREVAMRRINPASLNASQAAFMAEDSRTTPPIFLRSSRVSLPPDLDHHGGAINDAGATTGPKLRWRLDHLMWAAPPWLRISNLPRFFT